MRQLRIAAGDHLASAGAILNKAIVTLSPQARHGAGPGPHLIDRASFLQKLEKGHHARLDLARPPEWIKAFGLEDKSRLNTSRIPEWLVRAYDLAFCANGYLVDMYAWSTALLPDQLRDKPKRLLDLPAHVPPGRELAFFAEHFPDADERTAAVLAAQAEAVVALRERQEDPAAPWRPAAGDRSSSADETPEGLVGAPARRLGAGWVLHPNR